MFEDDFNGSAAIVRQKVRLHYTITPIGGKEELKQWKLDQAKQEQEWQQNQAVKRKEYREVAVSAIKNQSSRQLTTLEQKEIAYVNGRNNYFTEAYDEYLPTKKSLFNRIKSTIYKALFP